MNYHPTITDQGVTRTDTMQQCCKRDCQSLRPATLAAKIARPPQFTISCFHMLVTERLILRSYVESDLDDLLRLWNDPLVQPLVTNANVTLLGPRFKESLRAQMEQATFGAIIVLKETGEFMGQGSVTILEPKNRDGTLGICLLPKFWSNGYGTEATKFMIDHSFKWFGLNRMSLGVFAHNARAIALYEKLGFVMEGRKRQAVWMDNRWEDALTMGILRDEWEKKQQ